MEIMIGVRNDNLTTDDSAAAELKNSNSRRQLVTPIMAADLKYESVKCYLINCVWCPFICVTCLWVYSLVTVFSCCLGLHQQTVYYCMLVISNLK